MSFDQPPLLADSKKEMFSRRFHLNKRFSVVYAKPMLQKALRTLFFSGSVTSNGMSFNKSLSPFGTSV